MCGIAGIYAYTDKTIDQSELIHIRDQMHARGPDAAGLWINSTQTIGLAHRRLTIIDLSTSANQPMAFANERFHICYNGEIYNYRELREQLNHKGIQFQTQSDTEVLLALYAQYGPDMLSQLRGMFAFAIWDEQEQTLFLARDHFGIKPLYYANVHGQLLFASQVKALLQSTHISQAISPAGIVGYYTWGHVPDPHTCYQDIHALPAGHYVIAKSNHVSKPTGYFNCRDTIIECEQNAKTMTDLQCQSHLQAALAQSISHHLIADVPLGIFLSAGLDSTAIATLAAQQSPQALRTLTLSFKDYANTDLDEAVLAERVANQLQTRHSTHQMPREQAAEDFQHFLQAMDQPTIDGLNTYFVAKLAADANLKVVLSGLGGDELFGGYGHFNWLAKLKRVTRPISKIPGSARVFRRLCKPLLKARGITTKYAELLTHGHSIAELYFLRRALNTPNLLLNDLEPSFLKEGWEALQLIDRLNECVKGIQHPKLQITSLETQWYMRHQLLRDSDWAGMAHSLELRVPFVDIALFKSTLMCRNTYTLNKKQIIKQAVPTLPSEIINRKKTGFFVPIRQWILQAHPSFGHSIQDWSRLILQNSIPTVKEVTA